MVLVIRQMNNQANDTAYVINESFLIEKGFIKTDEWKDAIEFKWVNPSKEHGFDILFGKKHGSFTIERIFYKNEGEDNYYLLKDFRLESDVQLNLLFSNLGVLRFSLNAANGVI